MTEHRVELQSIRGIAALVVVLAHCWFYYAYDPSIKLWAEAAFNAHAAVICFFVLSGFVLTLSLERSGLGTNSLIHFFVRRGFRIYPVLWVASALALTYPVFLIDYPLPAIVDPWWGSQARSYPSMFTVGGAFTGVASSLKVPVWTLYIELVGSAFMPLLVFALSRGAIAFGAVTILLIILSQIEGWPMLLSPARYLIFFALGAAMTRTPPILSHLLRSPIRVILAAIGCFVVMWFSRWGFDARFLVNYNAPLPALIEGVAAAALIAVIYSSPAPFAFLRHRWSASLGDVSYSLYLLHLPILGWIAFTLGELLGLSVLSVATLCASLAASVFTYRFVELPGIKLGRAAAKSIGDRYAGAGAEIVTKRS
ncbi:acyltransferase [Ancylobacter aquaticus]|nr:acyltransferase [Ancylobacter aquaticus]